MKTVAAVSFNDNHSLSMDVEAVTHISISEPIELDDGTWVCELLVRGDNGIVAMQLVASSRERLKVATYG